MKVRDLREALEEYRDDDTVLVFDGSTSIVSEVESHNENGPVMQLNIQSRGTQDPDPHDLVEDSFNLPIEELKAVHYGRFKRVLRNFKDALKFQRAIMIRTHCGTCSKLEPPYPVNEPCAKCGGSHLSYGEVDSCVYSTATALTLQELIYYLAETFSEDYQVPYPDLVTLLQEVREQLMEYVRALHGDPST